MRRAAGSAIMAIIKPHPTHKLRMFPIEAFEEITFERVTHGGDMRLFW